jgi:hypothetical protein
VFFIGAGMKDGLPQKRFAAIKRDFLPAENYHA